MANRLLNISKIWDRKSIFFAKPAYLFYKFVSFKHFSSRSRKAWVNIFISIKNFRKWNWFYITRRRLYPPQRYGLWSFFLHYTQTRSKCIEIGLIFFTLQQSNLFGRRHFDSIIFLFSEFLL